MKIGIAILNLKSPQEGGGDTFREQFISSLEKMAGKPHEFYFFTTNDASYLEKQNPHFHAVNFISYASFGHRIRRIIASWCDSIFFEGRWRCCYMLQDLLDRAIQENPVDYMICFPFLPLPSAVPFSTIIWDLGAFTANIFPETVSQRMFCGVYLADKIKFASHVFIGNETGRKEVSTYYGIPHEKIRIIPFSIPDVDVSEPELSKKFGFKRPVLFYPAQFWAHKNHLTVLKAVEILRRKYDLEFDVCFSGGDKGNMEYIKEMTSKLGLSECVHFPGFISNQELGALYSSSFALVYASCLGPDNLPPLEAMSVGLPVISARFPGAEEQLGNAALFFDPLDEEQLASKIKELYDDPSCRERLVCKGKALMQKKGDYAEQLFDALENDFKTITLWKNE